MKKCLRRFICTVLAVSLVLSLCSGFAFAETTNENQTEASDQVETNNAAEPQINERPSETQTVAPNESDDTFLNDEPNNMQEEPSESEAEEQNLSTEEPTPSHTEEIIGDAAAADVSFAGGNGSESDPYQISTPEQLNAINNNLSANYILINDIDLSSWGEWIPIGGEYNPFCGTFDGNNFSVKNMNICTPSTYIGLFSNIENSTVKDLIMENITINTEGSEYIGGIAAYASGDINLINCKVNGNFLSHNGDDIHIGGMIGRFSSNSIYDSFNNFNYIDDIIIQNCENNSDITITNSHHIYSGGLLGESSAHKITIYNSKNNGRIIISKLSSNVSGRVASGGLLGNSLTDEGLLENCANNGEINIESDDISTAGGLIGNADGKNSVRNCKNTGNVTANTLGSNVYAGGILSSSYDINDTYISDCQNIGNVIADTRGSSSYSINAYAGGILSQAEKNVAISVCVNTGNIGAFSSEDDAFAGGILGNGLNADILNCDNYGTITGESNSGNSAYVYIGGIAGHSKTSTVTGVLTIADCNNYGNIELSVKNMVGGYSGGILGSSFEGLKDNETKIENCTNFGKIACTALDFRSSEEIFVGGIAGYLDLPGSIKNCVNNGILITSGQNYVGGIAGRIGNIYSNQTNDNISIEGCVNNGTISGSAMCVGGIVSESHRRIVNSCNYGNISMSDEDIPFGTAIGGIVGDLSGNIVLNCDNDAEISYEQINENNGGSNIGGICGRLSNAEIHNCNNTNSAKKIIFNSQKEKCDIEIGGICGFASQSSILESCNNYETIQSTLTNNIYDVKIGGIVGSVSVGIVSGNSSIINCTNDGSVSTNIGNIDGATDYSVSIGGICGGGYNFNLSNDYNNALVTTNNAEQTYLGGIAGKASNLTVDSCCYYRSGVPAIGNYGIDSYDKSTNIIGYEKLIPIMPKEEKLSHDVTFNIKGYTEDGTVVNEAVPGASVTFEGVSKVAGADGKVTFLKDEITKTKDGLYSIEVAADGYLSYSKDIIIANNMNISLIKKDPNKIYITELTAKSSSGKTYDLSGQKSVTIDKTDKTRYTFKITVDWNGHTPGDVYLRGSKSGKSFEFVNGELSVIPGAKFDIDESIIAVAYTQGKDKYAVKNNIIKIKALPDDVKLKLPMVSSGDMSFIPFMENMEFKLGLDKDITEYAGKASVEDGKLVLEFSGSAVHKSTNEYSIFPKSKVKFTPYGKIEIPIDDFENGEWGGTFGIKTESSKKHESGEYLVEIVDYNYNTVVVVGGVPVPVTATVAFKGGTKGEVKFSGNKKSLNITGKFEPSVGVDVFGGLGQDYDTVEFKAGVYGDMVGALPIIISTKDDAYLDPSLSGSIGARASVKVYIVNLEGEFEAGNFKWSKDGFEASWFNSKAKASGIDDNAWQLAGREYMNNGGGFVGDRPTSEAADLSVSNKTEQMIYQNIFDNSEAVLQNINGTNYLYFTVDADEREQQNGLKLVCSAQNSDGTWSAPVPVQDDGTLDSTISASGKFVVWEDMRSVMSSGDMPMKDILSQTEISAAYLNGTEWVSKRLTDNNTFDFSPTVSSNGDTAAAAWLSNSEADLSSQSGTTDLHYATFNGSDWSDVATVENIGAVTRIAMDGMNENVFYKKDGKIYYVSMTDGSTKQLNYTGVGQYTVGNLNGKTVLAYFDADNKLQIINDVFGKKAQTAIDADINLNSIPVIRSNGNNMYICWIDHNNGYDTLCGVRYNNGKWSEKITFVGDEHNISNPGIIVNTDGTFTVNYMKTGKAVVNDDGSYSTGETDLFVNTIVPTYNISLNKDTLDVSEDAYAKTGMIALSFDCDNVGEEEINGITVEVYENDELKQTIERNDVIKAGETKNIAISYMPDVSNTVKNLMIKALPSKHEDFNTDDNIGTTVIGSADAAVSNAYVTNEGGRYYVNAVIENRGSVAADNIEVQIHKGSIDGEVVYRETVENIMPLENTIVKAPVEITDTEAVYYAVSSLANDIDEYNNYSAAYFKNDADVTDFVVIDDEYIQDSNQIKLSVKTTNNAGEIDNATVILAAYNPTGDVLKKVMINENQSFIRGENIQDITFDCSGLSGRYKLKLLLWNNTTEITPISEVFEKDYEILN